MPLGVNQYDAGRFERDNVTGDSVSIISPGIVTDQLWIYLDAGNSFSYPRTGTTWTDIGARGLNLALTNTTFSTVNGGYLIFNGTAYGAAETTRITGSVGITLSAWAYTTTLASKGGILTVNSRDAGDRGYSILFGGGDANNPIYAQTRGTSVTAVSQFDNPSINTWYHVCGVFEGTAFRQLYVNGVAQTENTTIANGAAVINYGVATTTSSSPGSLSDLLNGRIAQAMIYDRMLSPDEISQNFNATRARFGV